MRLKILFFPIMLVISGVIFVGYIWPEIDNIKNINKEKLSNSQTLAAIKSKQAAIEQIGTQMVNDVDGNTMIDNYLPDKKVEEKIIGGINYFAADAGVSLADISIKDVEPAVVSGQNPAAPATGALSADGSANAQISQADTNRMLFSEVSISIIGDYSKIRLFIDELQRMALFSSIKSLAISNKVQAAGSASGSENTVNSTNLLSDIVVDFGYLKSYGLDNNRIAQFKPGLDNETISTLKQYISQKTASITSLINSSGNKGKTNPFLP